MHPSDGIQFKVSNHDILFYLKLMQPKKKDKSQLLVYISNEQSNQMFIFLGEKTVRLT